MKTLINDIIVEPWPWYIGGPLIGLFVIVLLLLQKKQLGISSSFQYICAGLSPIKLDYFKIDLKTISWQFWFVGGMVLGGVLIFEFLPTYRVDVSKQTISTLTEIGITNFDGFVPDIIYNSSVKSALILLFGGVLIGFGSRYANGCTAGHAIMGCAQLAPSSIISTVFFFAGGLLATYFILPLII